MNRILVWIGVAVLAVAVLSVWAFVWLTMGSGTLTARPALPTAIPGLDSKDQVYQTPVSKRTRTALPSESLSTPAAFATQIPPTPLPPPVGIPHSLAGKADCLYCHKGNTYFSVPKDHIRRTNETCLGCHMLSSSAPRPTARPARHSTEGHENCLFCHLQGSNGAAPVPVNHASRRNDTCRSCHRVK